jgi:hypothetical protein
VLRQLSRALRLLTAPLAWVLIYLVRLYQKVLSPILPSACRFRPTCSEYMVEALRKKGFVVGFCLGVWRILRCNPFCRGGYDPVE